jgi:hypothetical protein
MDAVEAGNPGARQAESIVFGGLWKAFPLGGTFYMPPEIEFSW